VRRYIEQIMRRRHLRRWGKQQDEQGFTLIELMVVLLIMAILLAVAIPTFLGVTSSAHNRAAQQELRQALTAIMSGYYKTDSFTRPPQYSSWHAWFDSLDPSLDFIGSGDVTGPGQISAYVWNGSGPNSQIIKMVDWSPSGMCWFILEIAQPGYSYPSGGPPDGQGPLTSPGTYYGNYSAPQPSSCGQGTPQGALTKGSWPT